MSYLFISHSSKNNFEAIAIHDWLMDQGWDELFLDLDPKRGIVAGERWEKALHDAASRCDAVLFLVSKNWLGSEWCRKEFRLAHRLNKRIIGILIEDIAIESLPEELTSTWQLVNLASGNDHKVHVANNELTGDEQHVHFSASGLTRLKTGLVKAGLDPLFFEWPPKNDLDRSPYRGMLPLEAEDAGIFFGRQAPTIELLAKLRGLRSDPPPRFMVILGASGAGKSSFLRAGILPRLSRDERRFITLPIIRPENSVLWGDKGLLESLNHTIKDVTRGVLRNTIKTDKSQVIQHLHELVEKTKIPQLDGETQTDKLTLVLSIDQAEELFQSEGKEESAQFLELLNQIATEPELPIIILFTIRSDSYERLQTTKALEGLSQQTFSLTPMPQGSYHQVIEGPANRLKDTDRALKIEPALTQRLLEDIEKGGNKDALPLLAFTLERLYLEYGDDGDLTLDEYQLMGGIDGAIEAAVERAIKAAESDPSLPNDKTQITNLLRRGLIPWLAGIDPNSQTPRRRVAKLSEIPTEALPIIKHLIEQRLLSTDKDEDNETTIEPAHESLLRQWGLLQGWLDEDFAALSILESVQRASRDWDANNRTDDYLNHNGGRLQDAEDLKQREDLADILSKNEWDYLKAARKQENLIKDRELEEARKLAEAQKKEATAQKKVAKRTKLGLVAALVLTVIAGVLGWQANNNKNTAILERDIGLSIQSNFVAELSRKSRIEGDYIEAMLLAKNVLPGLYGGKRPFSELASQEFKKAKALNLSQEVVERSSQLGNFSYSKDNKTIIISFVDGMVEVRDSLSFNLVNEISHGENIRAARLSPDNQYLVTVGLNKVKVWNPFSSELIHVIPYENQINSIDFDLSSSRFIFTDQADYAHIYDLKSGDLIQSLYHGEKSNLRDAVFLSNNNFVVTAILQGYALVWDIQMNKIIKALPHKIWLETILYDENTNRLIVENISGDLTIWNTENFELVFETDLKDSTTGSYMVISKKQQLFSCNTKKCSIFGLLDGQKQYEIQGLNSKIKSIHYDETNEITHLLNDNELSSWIENKLLYKTKLPKDVLSSKFNKVNNNFLINIYNQLHFLYLNLPEYSNNFENVNKVEVSPDGEFFVINLRSSLIIVNSFDFQEKEITFNTKINEFKISPDSNYISLNLAKNRNAILYDLKLDKEFSLPANEKTTTTFSSKFSSDSKKLIIEANGLYFWNIKSKSKYSYLGALTLDVSFTRNSDLIYFIENQPANSSKEISKIGIYNSKSTDQEVTLYETETNAQQLYVLDSHNILINGYDGLYKFYINLESGKTNETKLLLPQKIFDINNIKNYLVGSNGSDTTILEMVSQTTSNIHLDTVITFGGSDNLLLTNELNEFLYIWDINKNEVVWATQLSEKLVSADFSSKSMSVIAAMESGDVFIWKNIKIDTNQSYSGDLPKGITCLTEEQRNRAYLQKLTKSQSLERDCIE